jgi:hypothetical protein
VRLRWLAVLASLGLAGCSLLASFDRAEQPCDPAAAPQNQCAENYRCEDGRCVMGAFDGGN